MNNSILSEIHNCADMNLLGDIIGAAILLESDGSLPHAAIFIRYQGENKIFHYTGSDVLIEKIDDVAEGYYFKKFIFLDPVLLPSFLTQCELILENAKPQYGFFYSGSLYNQNGDFINPGDFPEFMTCVGFCLSVIKAFCDDDFLIYDDWNENTLQNKPSYADTFLTKVSSVYPGINIDDFRANLRRIFPKEYFSGAFSPKVPVSKAFVDAVLSDVENAFSSLAKKVA